jgi:hypothetical protein
VGTIGGGSGQGAIVVSNHQALVGAFD